MPDNSDAPMGQITMVETEPTAQQKEPNNYEVQVMVTGIGETTYYAAGSFIDGTLREYTVWAAQDEDNEEEVAQRPIPVNIARYMASTIQSSSSSAYAQAGFPTSGQSVRGPGY